MEYLISSVTNAKIKLLKNLALRKYRDSLDKFFSENLTTIYDAFLKGQIPEFIFLKPDLLTNPKVKSILTKIDDYYLITDAINKSFSCLDTPSGICAVYKKISQEIDFSYSFLYLDKLNDPGNLGTILRTALAFGVKNIILNTNCVDIYNPKTLSAAKNSVFELAFLQDDDFSIMKTIKEKMPIIVTDVQKGLNPKALQVNHPFCLVLGSESHGVCSEIKQFADYLVKIEHDKIIESLNVSVAAGIILYALGAK